MKILIRSFKFQYMQIMGELASISVSVQFGSYSSWYYKKTIVSPVTLQFWGSTVSHKKLFAELYEFCQSLCQFVEVGFAYNIDKC